MMTYSYEVEFVFGTRPDEELLHGALTREMYIANLVESEHENVAVVEFIEQYGDIVSASTRKEWEEELYLMLKPNFASLIMVKFRDRISRVTDRV